MNKKYHLNEAQRNQVVLLVQAKEEEGYVTMRKEALDLLVDLLRSEVLQAREAMSYAGTGHSPIRGRLRIESMLEELNKLASNSGLNDGERMSEYYKLICAEQLRFTLLP